MVSSRDQGSGTIIIIACGSSRPASVSSSRTLSNIAASEPLVPPPVRIFSRALHKSLERGVAGGHLAPAEQLLPLRAHGLLEEAVDGRLPGLAGREEDHAHPVVAGGGQLDPELVALPGEEGVRRLQEDAGAVAGVLLGAG